MGVADKISGFEADMEALRQAIEIDDADLVSLLDHKVSQGFGAILESVPQNDHETLLLVDFLLDQISPVDQLSSIQSQAKGRLLDLFRQFLNI